MTHEHAPSPDDEPDDLESRVADLRAHLVATAALPIGPRANRWLGEAEAVARDAASPGLDGETRRKRVRQVETLLAAVDGTGHDEADDRLEAARELCAAILEED